MPAHSSIPAWRIPDRGAWHATVRGVTKSRTKLSTDTVTKKKKKLLCKDLKNLNYTLKQPKEEITVEISNIRNILYENHGMQLKYCVSSVQFSGSDVSDSLRPHESQHARPACPSPTPGVHSDSRPSSQ